MNRRLMRLLYYSYPEPSNEINGGEEWVGVRGDGVGWGGKEEHREQFNGSLLKYLLL